MDYDLSTMRSDIRLLTLDTDSTTPGVSDAQLLLLINDKYDLWWSKYELDRVVPITIGTIDQDEPFKLFNSVASNISKIHAFAISGDSEDEVIPMDDYFSVIQRAKYVLSSDRPEAIGVRFTPTGRSDTVQGMYVSICPMVTQTLTISAWVSTFPTPLANTTDVCYVNKLSQRTIMRMAAMEAAMLLGRPADFVGAIAAPLETSVLSAMGMDMRLAAYRELAK